MHHNPLVIPILDILKQLDETIGEYELIKRLEEQGIEFPIDNDSYEMAMFKKHFMTMNALYSLQQELVEEGYHLSITALHIRLEEIQSVSGSKELVDDAELKVRDYYLDWQHFNNTSQQDVEELLNNFWKKYYSVDKQQAALQVLGLDEGADWSLIKSSYRRMAAEHHPDRGGVQSRFIEIREAFEVLRQFYQ